MSLPIHAEGAHEYEALGVLGDVVHALDVHRDKVGLPGQGGALHLLA